MPVFTSDAAPPAWCELRRFDLIRLAPGQVHRFERTGAKERLVVAEGECRIAAGAQTVPAEPGTVLDLATPEAHFEVTEVLAPATLVRMCGHWGDETGGCGLFTVVRAGALDERGDPTPYPKETRFDNHYHDCDEYWILYAGEGAAFSEVRSYSVRPGDCIATGMGHHHDFPQVFSPVKGVYFETTLAGRRYLGHLWNHTHGWPSRNRNASEQTQGKA
jgi:mannose-6-phosphate isomerase-like protein (cupin superfamily)